MKTKRIRPVLVEIKFNSIEEMQGDIIMRDNKLYTHATLLSLKKQSNDKVFELILISLEDEEIEVGEIGLDLRDNTLFEVKRILTNHYESGILSFQKSYCKKVIARQSQIPPKYISKFIEQYNNDCVEDFEIEMKTKTYQPCDNNYEKCGEPFNVDEPKLHNGFVTIVEKEYSHNLLSNMQYYMEYCQANGYVTPQDWLNKFKHYSDRKEPITYTEQEVYNLLKESHSLSGMSHIQNYSFKNWFNKHKKK